MPPPGGLVGIAVASDLAPAGGRDDELEPERGEAGDECADTRAGARLELGGPSGRSRSTGLRPGPFGTAHSIRAMTATIGTDVHALLENQQKEFRARRTSSAAERRARIQRVIDMLVARRGQIVEAIDADFGGRHPGYSTVNDVLGSLAALKYSRDHLEEWMQPEQRSAFAPYDQLGATASVQYQPKGSVAIIGTWNAPVFTLLSSLAGVLAAGNRAVLKPSELVPRTAQVLAEAAAEFLDPVDVAVVTGGPDVAQTLTALPFDHIVFTGGQTAGRSVLENAARNLVPVTLELGGKSPTIVGRSADLAAAAHRIAVGKATNAGQLCVNPDTVYVPSESLEAFVAAVRESYLELLPTATGNADATAVVTERHAARRRSSDRPWWCAPTTISRT